MVCTSPDDRIEPTCAACCRAAPSRARCGRGGSSPRASTAQRPDIADRKGKAGAVLGGDRRGAVHRALDGAREHVLSADEARHVGIARGDEDVAGAGGLLDAAMRHDDDRVGDRDGLELGMGDMDEGDAELLLHAAQLAAHAQAQVFVERGQRLVEQQHARIGDQRARQRHALLLAAGELGRQPVGEALELHLGQSSRALAWRSARPAPRILSAKATLSSTLRWGNRA